MDPAEFDRLIARARNPRLIPAIYNYCDGRCPRCPFTERCLAFLEQDVQSQSAADAESPQVDLVSESLERAIELIAEITRREGLDLAALAPAVAAPDTEAAVARHEEDPLVVRAREYGRLAWLVGRAAAPLVARRGDAAAIDAVDTIEWFSSRIGAKIYRAVYGEAEGLYDQDEVQTDFNGSAKAAMLGIRESHAAWLTLTEAGRAAADGVPPRAVKALEELDAAVRARFPRFAEFIRPGFDEPEVAAGAPAPPLPQRTRRGSPSR